MQLKNERFVGIDLQAASFILLDAGYCPVYVQLPSTSRGWTEMVMGRIDILVAASYTEERAKIAEFTSSYRDEVMRIFWKPQAGLQQLTLEQLLARGLTLAINPGAYYGPELASLRASGRFESQIVEVGSAEARFDMLGLGRVDMVIDDEKTGQYLLDEHGYGHLAEHPYIVHKDPVFIAIGKQVASQVMLDRINLSIIKNRDKVARLMAQ